MQNPDLGVFQVMFIKALICALILVITFNGDLKRIMVDSVPKESYLPLFFKTMQGSAGACLSYVAIRQFNVSTVGIACSLAPLLVCVLAYFFLGE